MDWHRYSGCTMLGLPAFRIFCERRAEMQLAPSWRLWTGVAFATLVVWLIVR